MCEEEKQGTTANTTRNIAYGMMLIYGVMLSAIGVIAATKSGEEGKLWIDLLKSGFLILGGGVTTITGYYFGSRPVQEAQEVAERAKGERKQTEEELAVLKREFAPTEDEDALIPEGEEYIEG